MYSAVTGVVLFAGFAGIASGSGSPTLNMAFGVAVVIAWAWVSALCALTRARLTKAAARSQGNGAKGES